MSRAAESWSWWGSADKRSPGSPEERQAARLKNVEDTTISWYFLIKHGFLMIDDYSACLRKQLATATCTCLFHKSQGNSPKASPFAHLYMFRVEDCRGECAPVSPDEGRSRTDWNRSSIKWSFAIPEHICMKRMKREKLQRILRDLLTIRTWDLDLLSNAHVLSKFLPTDIGRADRLGEICSWSLNEFHSVVPSSTESSASDSLALRTLKLCKNVCTVCF